MNVATVRRPMGCLKAIMRQTRHQRASARCLATAAAADAKPKSVFNARQRAWKEKVGKFEIWPQVPSVRTSHPDPLPALRQQQISELDPTGARTRLFSREHADSAKVGDVVMVTTRTGEPFAGVFIQMRRRGVDTAIQLRGQLMRTGVELWFKIYSPTVTGIDIIWRRPKRARRARLTYMRKPKHDKGSVEHLVTAWKKERFALSTKAKAKTSQAFGKLRKK
ncbi:ribosomal protein [Hirsutella rhossiliensis]|uniref:Ribosomal protein l19 domain-containing protein n=1 Tax=Hirsutella rhossiliensis TaxID=111463 RepID=A0A9P8N578_9HYPO|nr:ribosomal protein l19 domain-containing protein [Hirsutella rhossiliensis]KAH0966832.1 ribosomal protein l19 domain-containing protein [Hirsutella rhossiliensis]